MNFSSKFYTFLIQYKPDIKVVVIGTVVGGVLQIICLKYLENDLEMPQDVSDDLKSPKNFDQIKPKNKLKLWRAKRWGNLRDYWC